MPTEDKNPIVWEFTKEKWSNTLHIHPGITHLNVTNFSILHLKGEISHWYYLPFEEFLKVRRVVASIRGFDLTDQTETGSKLAVDRCPCYGKLLPVGAQGNRPAWEGKDTAYTELGIAPLRSLLRVYQPIRFLLTYSSFRVSICLQ